MFDRSSIQSPEQRRAQILCFPLKSSESAANASCCCRKNLVDFVVALPDSETRVLIRSRGTGDTLASLS